MIEKFIGKVYAWSIKRARAKQQKKNKGTIDKKREEFYIRLQGLYEFAIWLNTKGLSNRRERKTFWRNVADNVKIMPETIAGLRDKYAPPKKKEEVNPFKINQSLPSIKNKIEAPNMKSPKKEKDKQNINFPTKPDKIKETDVKKEKVDGTPNNG